MTDIVFRPRNPARQWHGAAARLVIGMLALAWISFLAWSIHEVVLTRSSQTANGWIFPELAGLLVLVAFTIVATGRVMVSVPGILKAGVLGAAAITLAVVIWVAKAPLPELKAVPIPPAGATPAQVTQAFVAAVDEHDRATAAALCMPGTAPCGDLNSYVRLTIVRMGRTLATTAAFHGKRVPGVEVQVEQTGLTRSGGKPGDGVDEGWGYVLAPVGPHGAWRLVDEGLG